MKYMQDLEFLSRLFFIMAHSSPLPNWPSFAECMASNISKSIPTIHHQTDWQREWYKCSSRG